MHLKNLSQGHHGQRSLKTALAMRLRYLNKTGEIYFGESGDYLSGGDTPSSSVSRKRLNTNFLHIQRRIMVIGLTGEDSKP
jgi:hypothetical protein